MCSCTRTTLPREAERSRAVFGSATTDSLTLTLKDGQTRTVQKQAVRKVLHPPTVQVEQMVPASEAVADLGNLHRANRIRH